MSGYIGTQPVPQATQTRQTFVATAAQTSFATGGYQAGYLDVFLNGVKLQDNVDYTATNGSDIVLTVGAALDDTLEVVAYTAFEVLDQTFTGTTTVTDSGAAPLVANRTTSDGDITIFQKDGAPVGSIGSLNGGLFIDGNPSAASRLAFGTSSALYPETTDVADIGFSGNRFKDLYLSGGVYLGGTGAANKLDDYEEGTFTPVLYGGSVDPSVTYTIRAGSYTKVGNTVTVLVDVRWSAQSGGSGVAIIGGLPFPSVASYSYCAVGEKSSSWNYSTFTQYTVSIINNNQARVLVSGNGLGSLEFPITSLGTGNGYILFSLTYKTHA